MHCVLYLSLHKLYISLYPIERRPPLLTAPNLTTPQLLNAPNLTVSTTPQNPISTAVHASPIPTAGPVCSAALLSTLPPSRAVPANPPACLSVLPTPKAVDPKPAHMCNSQQPMLPCHIKFRPDMTLPNINNLLRPHFPKSKVVTKQEIINSIDEFLNIMIKDLSSQGKYLPCQQVREILQEQLRNFKKSDGQHISVKDIPSWEKFYKCHGRVEELIKLFCILSPFTSIHEMEQAIISSEEVHNFEELCLGPILKHPIVQQHFKPPHDLKKVPEISYYDIMSSLKNCMQQNRRGPILQLDAVLEFMQKKFSVPSKEHLCIRISSFPLAIQVQYTSMFHCSLIMQAQSTCILGSQHSISSTVY